MSLSEAVKRRVEAEERMAQRSGESNKERWVDRKV